MRIEKLERKYGVVIDLNEDMYFQVISADGKVFADGLFDLNEAVSYVEDFKDDLLKIKDKAVWLKDETRISKKLMAKMALTAEEEAMSKADMEKRYSVSIEWCGICDEYKVYSADGKLWDRGFETLKEVATMLKQDRDLLLRVKKQAKGGTR